MMEGEVLPQKVVATKTLVLKSRLDYGMAVLQGEKLKKKFFRRLGFLEPKAEDIQLVGAEKHYEPYLVIGGKYSIDYYRRQIRSFEVEGKIGEIFFEGQKLQTLPSDDPSTRIIHFEGEETANYNEATYFILDKFRREVPPETFPFAPYQSKSEAPQDLNLPHNRFDSSVKTDIDFLRRKIAKRPNDVVEVKKEIFEITERTIVYSPFYELTFQNTKTGKEAALQINGVSGKMLLFKPYTRNQNSSPSETIETIQRCPLMNQPKPCKNRAKKQVTDKNHNDYQVSTPESIATDISQSFIIPKEETIANFPVKVKGEIFTVGDNITAVIGDLEIPSGTHVNEALVVKGNLKVGDKCRISKKLKVLGEIAVGSNAVIEANIIAGKSIDIGANSIIQGSIKAKGKIKLKANVAFKKEVPSKTFAEKEPSEQEFIVASEEDQSVVSCEA